MNRSQFIMGLGVITKPLSIPILYRASSLSAVGTGGIVTSWTNQGTTGSTHDLKLRYSGNNPTYQPASGSNPASIRMTDVSFETLGLLPNSFSGPTSRTIGICSLMESEASLNLLGYGIISGGQLFDVMAYGGNYLFPHYYGFETYVGPRNQIGVFQVAIVRSTAVAGSPTTVDFFSNNGFVNSQQRSQLLNTGSGTPLFVGAGVFNGYNLTTPRRISGVFMADYAMTDAEIQTATSLLIT